MMVVVTLVLMMQNETPIVPFECIGGLLDLDVLGIGLALSLRRSEREVKTLAKCQKVWRDQFG